MHRHDLGLAADLPVLLRRSLLGRRWMLGLLAGAGLIPIVGCGPSGSGGGSSTSGGSTPAGTSAASTTTAAASCEELPAETAGPFPGDGSNGPNALAQSGIVRSDIRSSIGTASGVADGVPLTIELTVQDAATGCAPLAGAAVYLWHCDRNGGYSMYSREVAGENYLRGVQAADGSGLVRFTSIFPAAYAGRWPHIHFEVYRSLAETGTSGKIAISQLALPKDVCETVYATDGYAQSVQNLARTSLESDNVFRDGYRSQLAAVTGSNSSGYTARLAIPVRAG